MAKILWYDGKSDGQQLKRVRKEFAAELPEHTLMTYDTAAEAVKALQTERFDAIVTSTGTRSLMKKDGTVDGYAAGDTGSGFVVQDEALRLGLNTPRIILTSYSKAGMDAIVAQRYPQESQRPIVISRGFDFANDIENRVLPLLTPPNGGGSGPTRGDPNGGRGKILQFPRR